VGNSVDKIISYFAGGFQRVNRFQVTVGGQQFWAAQCQIPQQYIVWYPEYFSPSGPSLDIPIRREYDDRFLIDFIVEGDWKVRRYFEQWYDRMFTPITSTLSNTVQYKNTPANLKDIKVEAVNDKGEVKATFTLYEAYPQLILPSQFSDDIPNQYLTLTVDFGYRYYRFT
jgi:hypothetical protein